MKAKLNNGKSLLALLVLTAAIAGCGQNAANSPGGGSVASADQSASGAAASAAGGALSDSGSGGTQALNEMNSRNAVHGFWALIERAAQPATAYASSLCPTFATTGSGCSVSGSNMWLTYSSCTFAGLAQWTGVQEISMSSGTDACGSFPNPGANGTLYRQFVQSSGSSTPGSVTLTVDSLSATIDDATANLGNFAGDTISPIHNGGYGAAVDFNGSGARTSITFGHHEYVTNVFDHSVSGNLSVNETAGATSRTLSGNVTVYHNRMKVIGTSTFTNVVHENICCLPVSGTITTSFAAKTGISPTTLGALMVGKSETLTFTGCGTATYTDVSGTTSNVTLHRCF